MAFESAFFEGESGNMGNELGERLFDAILLKLLAFFGCPKLFFEHG